MAGDSKLIDPIRSRGHRGGVITMHRAFTHFRMGPMNLFTGFTLFVVFFAIWIALLPFLCEFWGRFLALGLRFLPLQARLDYTSHEIGLLRLKTPTLRMDAVLPDSRVWSATAFVTFLVFAGMFFFPKKFVPIAYLVRAILAVQFTALFYFAAWPSRFPHTPDAYMEALLDSGIGIITIVPMLFGMTYYIFDFGLPRKAFLTALTMVHLSLFLPFQVILQALVLQKSLLFMPLLYIVFGTPVNVLLIVCFYSWGMTWSMRSAGGFEG